MLDPQRIPRIVAKLEALWRLHPDWRLGQLLVNIFETRIENLYYYEDDIFESGLEYLAEKIPPETEK